MSKCDDWTGDLTWHTFHSNEQYKVTQSTGTHENDKWQLRPKPRGISDSLALRGTQNLWLATLGNLRGNNILQIQDSALLVMHFFLLLSGATQGMHARHSFWHRNVRHDILHANRRLLQMCLKASKRWNKSVLMGKFVVLSLVLMNWEQHQIYDEIWLK